MPDTWKMEAPARRLAARLKANEILKIDEETAAMPIRQNGTDYMVTITRYPKQRPTQ